MARKAKSGVRYVNSYLVDRAYGGPEEGGWWYEVGIPNKSTPVTNALREAVERVSAEAWATEANQVRRPLSSVLSDGVYVVTVEDHPARRYPRVRPHYE